MLTASLLSAKQEPGLRVLNRLQILGWSTVEVANSSFTATDCVATLLDPETGREAVIRSSRALDSPPLLEHQMLTPRFVDRVLSGEDLDAVVAFAGGYWASPPC